MFRQGVEVFATVTLRLLEGKEELTRGGSQSTHPVPCQEQDSRIAVGLFLVALVVLHVQCHLAGLAMEACFMPELGMETEGGHTSDTKTSEKGAQALGRGTLELLGLS